MAYRVSVDYFLSFLHVDVEGDISFLEHCLVSLDSTSAMILSSVLLCAVNK